MMAQQPFGSSQSFGGHFNGQSHDSIDPAELSMQNNNFGGMSFPFGSQQNLSSSFNLGNSGIADDELMDSLDMNNMGGQNNAQGNSMNNFGEHGHSTGINMGQMNNVFSSTPEGGPIQSPFVNNNFNYDQFRPNFAQHMSPRLNGTPYEGNYINAKRPSLQGVDRRSSDQRSPMTPKTPAIGALHLGTPDSGSFPTQIRSGSLQNRHQKTLSNQWDSTPGSLPSFVDSPISSPGQPHHTGISEILKSGKHASLPTNVDVNNPQVSSTQSLESQEAKRRRRRASHNLVERRRRDNINERIQDLSHLVPQHRLEDDRVRKALANNSPLSPIMGGSSMSPPNSHTNAATSLLAGASGRRAASTAGNITIGLPIEEKEKGPNKGDILNGAVGWTRDLMWALYAKIQQEQELEALITSLGGSWPFEVTEDEKRMRSELLEAMERNDASSFSYSRGAGSGLRVPMHTNHAGEPLQQQKSDTMSPQSLNELSPPFTSGGSGTNSGGQGQPQYWNTAGHAGISFKEEDEYQMDL
ncbi:putative hlh transcription factor (gamma) [Phaeomoniella chlamydospora]|uniref:Putative hlh transcription factor (Gamma) n=1 Tax=Phaeomoniella chlamydospora TaxID=158046 RepID=A0A0G2ES26_PHACM|nr:putative hlh transcription factor (gamma) [Phaeomoniella chlamydospora]